jgi:hypothetical protein
MPGGAWRVKPGDTVTARASGVPGRQRRRWPAAAAPLRRETAGRSRLLRSRAARDHRPTPPLAARPAARSENRRPLWGHRRSTPGRGVVALRLPYARASDSRGAREAADGVAASTDPVRPRPEDRPMLMLRLQGLLLVSALVSGLVWLAFAF